MQFIFKICSHKEYVHTKQRSTRGSEVYLLSLKIIYIENNVKKYLISYLKFLDNFSQRMR